MQITRYKLNQTMKITLHTHVKKKEGNYTTRAGYIQPQAGEEASKRQSHQHLF